MREGLKIYKNRDAIGKQKYHKPGMEAELNFEFLEFDHYIF